MNTPRHHPPHIQAQLAAVDARINCDRIIRLLDKAETRLQARQEIHALVELVGTLLDAADQMLIDSQEEAQLTPPLDYAKELDIPQPAGLFILPAEEVNRMTAILWVATVVVIGAAAKAWGVWPW